MKILLTGGTGFIGSYVLKYLLESGHGVNLLVRDPERLVHNNHPQIKVFPGSINNIEAVNKSIIGCDIVIHLAALVRTKSKNSREFSEINFGGTVNLLEAAKRNGIKKFIFTSSLAAHSCKPDSIVDEKSLVKPEKFFNQYGEAKANAEDVIKEYSTKGLPYVIIFPARLYGIGQLNDANAATKAISLYLKNRLPFLVDKGEQYSSWAFVEDVARGIISAALNNVSNQSYLLGGENRTLKEIYDIADRICGKRHLRININMKTALIFASLIERAARAFRRHPLITPDWLKFILESQKISSQKAMTELDYKMTPIETALEKTINWMKTL